MNIKENSEKTSRSSAANDKMTTAQQLYIQKHHRHHHLVTLLRLLVLVLFLSLWEFSGRTGLIDTFFFSSPSMVVSFFIEMVTDGSFFSHTGITLLETLVSFLLITIISILLATLLWYSKTLSEVPKASMQELSVAEYLHQIYAHLLTYGWKSIARRKMAHCLSEQDNTVSHATDKQINDNNSIALFTKCIAYRNPVFFTPIL